MADIVLTADEYNQVRYLIDNEVTVTDLSDDEINYDVNLGASERYVDRIVWPRDLQKNLSELNDVQTASYRRAILYHTAGRAVMSVKQIISEGAGGISESYEGFDWQAKQEVLFTLCEDELDGLVLELRPKSISYSLVGVTSPG